MTYPQVDSLSSQFAAHLMQRGVAPEVIVPLLFEKSLWTIIAMLGVMKAGGAFALMDLSASPATRVLVWQSSSVGGRLIYAECCIG